MPCWCELSWRDGVVVRIHQDIVAKRGNVSADAPIVPHIKKQFGFENFCGQFRSDFGFESSLKYLGEKDDFLEYSVPAVLVRHKNGKCRSCEGSGKDEYFERTCMFCDGEGEEYTYIYKEAFAVSASLSLLLDFISYPEENEKTSNPFPQLITLQVVTIADSHGGSLGGEYSKDVVDFLRGKPNQEMSEMVSAMKAVHRKMEGQPIRDFYEYSFRAYTQDGGRLIVDCPGDACGLHPSSHWAHDNEGYEFSCHNVDQMIQQMELIAALAVLHDLVRKSQTPVRT